MKTAVEELASWLAHWNLTPDGAEIQTASSILLPVKRDGVELMLKFAQHKEEERGNRLMSWWAGQGAATVVEHEGAALLMERCPDPGILELASDDVALPKICATAMGLQSAHANRQPPEYLVPLRDWFSDLSDRRHEDENLQLAAECARSLLAQDTPHVILHGDMHHGNVLRFGDEWRVIDPKGLIGPSGFEFANLFLNPMPSSRHRGKFTHRLREISDYTGLSQVELTRWVFAWSALSSIWSDQDGNRKAATAVRKFMCLAQDKLVKLGANPLE